MGSSLILVVEEKQDQDPIFLELKANVQKQKVLSFEQEGYLRYQGRLCVPMVDGLQERIMEEVDSHHFISRFVSIQYIRRPIFYNYH